jgi:hypothetical protein
VCAAQAYEMVGEPSDLTIADLHRSEVTVVDKSGMCELIR